MKKPFVLAVLGAVAFSSAIALAGSFTSDFSNPNQLGFTLNSNWATRPNGETFTPVIQDGHLVLTWNENSEQGTIVFDDLDNGAAIEGFIATFKLQIGPGSGNPADGVAFCFGPGIDASSNFGEEGLGTGVAVCFDTYDNGGGEAPAVDVKYGDPLTTLATVKFAKADMVTGVFEDVRIQVTRSGTISVTYKGQKLFDNLMLPGYAPMTGLFAIGARTGGENANQWLDDLTLTTALAGAPAQPSVTRHPQSQTVNEGSPVTFSIEFDGSAPLSFQWKSNNVAIDGADGPSYTIARVPYSANNARYLCTVSNTAGSADSNPATLTVNADTTAPVLMYATGSASLTKVKVWFSEPMDPASAQTAANYRLSGGLTVTAAALAVPAGTPGDHVVFLTTSQQAEGATLTLTVNNVRDVAGNLIAANSTKTFSTFIWVAGSILQEYWNNVNVNAIAALTSDPRFPDRPSFRTLEPMYEYPRDGANEGGSYYGNKLSGWFIPSTTANYIFFTCSDDPSDLYLSTDANPENKKLIAQETGWSSARRWLTTGSGDPTSKRSDTFGASEWPTPNVIHLIAGRKYYLESLHTEGGGGDNVGATFILEGESDPEDGSAPRLTGNLIGTYLDPNVELTFTRQPTDQVGVVASTGIQILSQTFDTDDGGFTVVNTDPEPPGPWLYDSFSGKWITDGAVDGCGGPYNSQLNSPPYALAQDGAVSLSFTHRYSFEGDYYDAGIIRYSVNGGPFTLVLADNFSANGYAPGNIVGNGIALGLRAFNGNSPGYVNGDFITSKVLLGNFSRNDTLVVQFLAAYDECVSGLHPNWEIDSLALSLLPMIIQDFGRGNGSFTVQNTTPAPPGPWVYNAAAGQWAAEGSVDGCGGPYNSKLNSPAYVVPQTDEVTLSFTHRYSFEGDYWDGGQVRISVNGGPFTPVPADNFTANGYAAGVIQGTGELNGQRAFNGDSPGYAAGTLITSSAVLGRFNRNDTIVVQFAGCWDECASGLHPSWLIKNVQLSFGTAAKATTFEGAATATLHGETMGVNYQWQRNDGAGWVNIPLATAPAYRFFPVAADFNATFRLVASVLGKSITSQVVRLTTGVVEPPEVSISVVGGQVTLQFTGRLQSAAQVNGPYTDVAGAQSPYVINPPAAKAFFRSVR